MSQNKYHRAPASEQHPKCDFCGIEEATYDGKTEFGAWAYMCNTCFIAYGVGLGIGKGQRLVEALEGTAQEDRD